MPSIKDSDLLADACPEHREALFKFIMTGDLDREISDHLDACPTCTAVVDRLRALAKKTRP